MQPSPQEPQAQPPAGGPQPYYGYAQPSGPTMPIVVGKKVIFLIVAVGVLLVWIAQLVLWAFRSGDPGVRDFMEAVYYTGTMIGLGGSLLGALGSPRTTDWQNLGLLVLAGFFVAALIVRL